MIDSTQTQTSIEMLAGTHPSGEAVIERVAVAQQEQANTYLLLASPVFVRGVARGDLIVAREKPKGAFEIKQHSGNLCVRVFSKRSIEGLEQQLTGEVEKLGGQLDIREQRVLVYSIHVSVGFKAIEALFDKHANEANEAIWYYGNVYDPNTGEPLNWWQPILNNQ